jgi:hypothetical protein
MRCHAEGPAIVGARLFNAAAYFDIPAGRNAIIAISPGGIACGLAD